MISPFFRKLMLLRSLDIYDGEFIIFKNNFSLFPTSAIIELRKRLKKEGKLEILYKLGEDITESIITHFKKYASSKEGSLTFWLNMIELSGLGKLEIIETKEDMAVINCKNSTVARLYGNVGEAVDELLAGIINAYFTFRFSKPTECKEVACLAKGERYCQFIVKVK